MTTLKYVRIFSDTHLDRFFKYCNELWNPIPLETDSETALILAGDIWEGDKFIEHSSKSWIKPLSERFHSIIIVLGNHDCWGENLTKIYKKIQNRLFDENLFNVHLLQNNKIIIDGTKFLGGTLWTDFNNKDPFTIWQAKQYMNDYNYIRIGDQYRKLLADDILKEHIDTRDFIFESAHKKDCEKVIVVSHHTPSFQTCDDRYKGGGFTNGYYHTELGDNIVDSEIGLWCYGHTHAPKQFNIGNTLLVNNAVGYVPFEQTGYDPECLIDIANLK
jgi:predicted phosphodiesterase